MKFGKYIQSVAQEWATPYYLNYKALKKVIKTETTEKEELDQVKKVFFFRIEREVEKINEFYSQKETEFKQRLDMLLRKSSRPSHQLREGFLQFQLDLAKLQKYVHINATGFRKILKKWDKRAHAHTKEIYLSRKIEIQPCFNNEVLLELAKVAAEKLTFIESQLGAHDEPVTDSHRLLQILKTQPNLQEYVKSLTITPEFLSRSFVDICDSLDYETAKILLETDKIDCNLANDVNNQTCLHALAVVGKMDLVELVLQHGAKIDTVDFYGRTCLHYACIYSHVELTKFLVSKGALVNVVDQDGNTPLIYAVIGGNLESVSVFTDHESTLLNSADFKNPLSVACQYGRLEIVNLLLAHKVPQVANNEGLYPIHTVCQQGRSDIAECLLDNGADMEVKDTFNAWTPVFFSASEGHLSCIQLLIRRGCNLTLKDDNGWLPVTHALYMGHLDAANLLRVDALYNQSSKGVEVKALAPSELFANSDVDQDDVAMTDELDDIPSLSLPPPMIPLRIYGHHYLEDQFLIQLEFGTFTNHTYPNPLRYTTNQEFSSVQLKVTCKPDGLLTFFTNIPLKEELVTFLFKVDSLDNLYFEFDLLPAFGSKCLGRGSLPSAVVKRLAESDSMENAEHFVHLFDSHLQVFAEISFRMSIIKPFMHPSLLIGGNVDTYWKATTIEPSSHLESKSMATLVTSTSLAKEFVELYAQFTRDGVVVIHESLTLKVGSLNLSLCNCTYNELKQCIPGVDLQGLGRITDSRELVDSIRGKLLTLDEALTHIMFRMGIVIVMVHPFPVQRQEKRFLENGINRFVDSCLKAVYDSNNKRPIIFASSNPEICSVVNWKQPNYGVFFRTMCGKKDHGYQTKSIKESIKFAKSHDLLGVLCDASTLIQSDKLVMAIKERGLIVGSFGDLNVDSATVAQQVSFGVDVIVFNGVFRYNE